jgi:hypothetical protein
MVEHERSAWKSTTVVFLFVFLLLLVFQSNRVTLTQDEGLTLDPAQRMAAGERVYVDFFAALSPGSYWLQELMFRLFGLSLWAGRLMVMLDFSVQCALLFWLTARLASSKVAVTVLLLFAGFQISSASFLTAAHRWDSGTLALAGLCLAVHCAQREVTRGTPWIWAASGMLLAAAAWCTPSVGLLIAVEGIWLMAAPARRNAVVPFVSGVMGVTALAVAGLAVLGSLSAFFHQLLWLRENYAGINFMPYGSINGGYRNFLDGTDGIGGWLVRLVMVACIALPAILPPVALAAWIAALWRGKVAMKERPELLLLLLAMGSLIATAFPRANMVHLAFVATLPYALAGAALARLAPAKASAALAVVPLMLATIFAANYFIAWHGTSALSSPVGRLRVSNGELADFERLFQEVRPGDGLFVYPYMPIHYFLTQGKNPVRFSWLQPGMMPDRDARATLAELQARPPEWLLYAPMSPKEYRDIFPYAPNVNWRFEDLESWLETNYRPAPDPKVTVGGYRLWRRFPAEVQASR